MGNIYFTADTHFGQQRTLDLSRRPFSDTRTMNSVMIQRWNELIDDDDIVFHLGDFGEPTLAAELAGKIRLLPGNYDTPEVIERLLRYKHVSLYNMVLKNTEVALFVPESHWGLPLLHLVHAPENAVNANEFYLYGHIHQLQMVKRNGLNVGVDCHQFRPIGLDAVKFYYDAITKHYDKNVFIPVLGE